MSQLRELAKPFHGKYVQPAPQGKYGEFVSHSTINERLLQALGPFSLEVVQIVRGHAEEIKTAKRTYPARENAVVGVVARLTATVDGKEVRIEEVGAEDSPAMKGDGDNLKTSLSDALKRCAMRLGLGLHLWSGDLYFLDRALERDTSRPEKPQEPPVVAEPTRVLETVTGADGVTTDAPTMASQDQRTAVNRELKKQRMTKEDAVGFFRWLTGRDNITGSADLEAREATTFLALAAQGGLENALADYAVEASGGPPDVSDLKDHA